MLMVVQLLTQGNYANGLMLTASLIMQSVIFLFAKGS